MKSPLVITSLVIAGLLILAGVSYFLFHSPSPTEPPPQDTPPAEQPSPPKESKPIPEQPALSFEQQIEDLKIAIASVCATGESKEVTLVVTETEVNDQATKLLTQVEVPEDIPLEIKSVHINFEANDSVIAEIKSDAYGFELTIKLRAQVSVEEGKPKVEVTDVSFGFIPLPQSIKDRIVVYITQEIEDLLSRMTETAISCNGTTVSLEFKDINVQQTKMTVTVIIKPTM